MAIPQWYSKRAKSGMGHSETFVKGQSVSALPHDSDINLFRYCERVVDLDA
jgi:hypothetical protein